MLEDPEKQYSVPERFALAANLTPERYKEKYSQSINDPETFWADEGRRLDWMTPYTNAKNTSWEAGDVKT